MSRLSIKVVEPKNSKGHNKKTLATNHTVPKDNKSTQCNQSPNE